MRDQLSGPRLPLRVGVETFFFITDYRFFFLLANAAMDSLFGPYACCKEVLLLA